MNESSISSSSGVTIETLYAKACETPSDINEHLPTLRRYAHGVHHVTEFGIRNAVSSLAFLAPHVWLKSYDAIITIEAMEIADLAINEGRRWVIENEDTRSIQIEATDLLFIDTLHTEEQLTHELWKHHEKVRQWIILHDTETFWEKGELIRSRGLRYAVEPFIAEAPWKVHERFTNNNGLMILCRT